MGDRLAVLNARRAAAARHAASDVYERPANLFVARFIGSPAMNVLPARLEEADGALVAVVAGQRLPAAARAGRCRPDRSRP